MKDLTTIVAGKTQRVSFCSVADARQKIEIAGQVLVPDEDTAYVEFFLSHALPVVNLYRTAILPQVLANSHRSLVNKVFNLAHLMRRYNEKEIARDRILGTVVAVELVDGTGATIADLNPEGGWPLAADKAAAQGIRGVAVMHKAAESVLDILTGWFMGENPYGGEWTVSIENAFFEEDCGFLVKSAAPVEPALDPFVKDTPPNLLALGYVYVPCRTAPAALMACLNSADDDRRDGINSTRICRNFKDWETILLLGGLDHKIRYRGVGLTPADGAREDEARVRTMVASAPVVDAREALDPFLDFGAKIFSQK